MKFPRRANLHADEAVLSEDPVEDVVVVAGVGNVPGNQLELGACLLHMGGKGFVARNPFSSRALLASAWMSVAPAWSAAHVSLLAPIWGERTG